MSLNAIRNPHRRQLSRAGFISRALRALAPWTAAVASAGIALAASPPEARADTPPEAPAASAPPTEVAPSEPTEPASAGGAPAAETPPKPKPAPYSLPWQLRPAGAATVVRSDTAFAFMKDAKDNGGATIATMLLGSYAVIPELAVLVRAGLVSNGPPVGENAISFVNPAVGATYALKPAPELRLAFFLGATIPVGMGGGNTPDVATAAATKSGALARSAFDNAMFAVNYFTLFPGVDFAYVAHGLTIQAEVTLFQLMRVRGDEKDKDAARTNLTTGLHVGYFLVPELSLGAELRYQRWLKNPTIPDDNPTRDNVTVAVGPRAHFKIGEKSWFRPGIAYARGLDNPMSDAKYNIVQLDLPFSF